MSGGTAPPWSIRAWSLFLTAATVIVLAGFGLLASRQLAGHTLWMTLDGQTHVYRVFELGRTLNVDNGFPRWSPDFVYDYGYPLMNFYAPLLYYVAASMRWLTGLSDLSAVELVVVLSLVVSAFSMYLLAKELLGRAPAVLAAAAYVFWPYRMAVVYVRGDVPEVLSYALLPFVLWGCYRWIAAQKPSLNSAMCLAVAGMAFAAVVLTHNLTAFYFSPLLLIFIVGLLLRQRDQRQRRIIGLAVMLAWAMAASAVFWLPALAELPYLRGERLFVADYAGNMAPIWSLFQPVSWRYFYYPDTGNLDTVFPFGFVSAVSLLPGLVALMWVRQLAPMPRLALALLASFVTLALLGMWNVLAPLSAPLSLLQSPYRLLGFAALGVGPLAGAGLLGFNRLCRQRFARTAALLGAIVFLVVSSTTQLQPKVPDVVPPLNLDAFHVREFAGRLVGTTWAGEFLPRWVGGDQFSLGVQSPQSEDGDIAGSTEPLSSAVSTKVLLWQGLDRKLLVSADQEWQLVFHTFYYPSWTVEIDGQSVGTSAVTPLGLLGVRVPSGNHEVRLRLDLTPVERLASAISLLAVTLACAIGGIFLFRRLKRPIAKRLAAMPMFVLGLALLAASAGVLFPELVRHDANSGAVSPAGHQAPARLRDSVAFGSNLALVDYRFQTAALYAGGLLPVDLFWLGRRPMADDLSAFVHLTDQDGAIVAQHDDRPDYGFTPTTRWVPGEIVADRHRLAVPENLPGGIYLLIAGVNRTGSDVRLAPASPPPPAEDGQPIALGDHSLLLGKVRIGDAGRESGNPPLARFGGQFDLLGYDLPGSGVLPGGELRVEMRWRSISLPTADYTVFVHLVGDHGLVAQSDHQPRGGRYPTTLWDAGETVSDSFSLAIPASTPLGKYRLLAGLYQVQTMQRLTVSTGQDGATQDTLDLGEVTVK